MEKNALQKLLTFFQPKYWRISDTNILNFNEALTNDVVTFEQPGPGVILITFVCGYINCCFEMTDIVNDMLTNRNNNKVI